MRVRILFFAQLKDLFGEGERAVEVREGTSAGELVELLLRELGRGGLNASSVRYAVNEKFEVYHTELHQDDALALIPPVSGG